jgi:RHS repeat-associated protein
MDSAYGAALYYSPKWDTTSINKYIPNGHGFIFTQTEYTQDNTGRISRQGGVGETFKLGSGHETKYFYGTADQNEIDALFGTEAGNSTHYFKNMVRDANGQFSVSYVDMHGRTIATALAGNNPTVMDALSSYNSVVLTENLADSNSNVMNGYLMQSKKSLLIAKAGTYYFNYNLSPDSLKKASCDNNLVCYNCLYDLEIKITSDCNNQNIRPNGIAFDTIVHKFSLAGSKDTSGFHLKFQLQLNPGNFEVTKNLSVSQPGLQYYRDSIFMFKNTCRTVQQFIDSTATAQMQSECEPSCTSCYANLGTIDSFRTHFMIKTGVAVSDTASYHDEIVKAYYEALDACKALCDSTTVDQADIRSAMLRDVSAPSGQYANIDNIDSFSVFYKATISSIPEYQSTSIVYKDENGLPDSVYDDATGTRILPQQLSQEQFAAQFKASWAETLLPFHPEYCKFLHYDSLSGSANWDNDFLKIKTYTEGNSLGYLNPTAEPGSPFNHYTTVSGNQDSLVILRSFVKPWLKDTIEHYRQIPIGGGSPIYVSLWTMAAMSARCGSDSACMVHYITGGLTFDSLACDGEQDVAWQNFQGLYLNAKRNIVDSLIRKYPCTGYTTQQLFAAGHNVNFDNAANSISQHGMGDLLHTSDPAVILDSAKNIAGSYYKNNCEAYANIWITQLAPCNYDSIALHDTIIPKLVAVCEKGSDPNHPFGSREIAPDSTNTFDSFDDVINDYNSHHGITNAKVCNADLIRSPAPYSNQLIYSYKPILTKPSTCECEQITKIHTEYTTHALFGVDTTFSLYLKNRYHTTISEGDLDQLLAMCNGTAGNCNYLTSPISLPPVLQCGTTDICIDCAKFDTLYQEFHDTYDTVPVYTTPGDTTYKVVNLLFANFMNNKLGFNKQSYEYLDFMHRCNNAAPQKCVGCDSLQKLVNAYFDTLRSNAGSEAEMLKFIHDTLFSMGLNIDTSSIRLSLLTCNNSWQKNVAFNSGDILIFRGEDLVSGDIPNQPKTKNLGIGKNGDNCSIEFWTKPNPAINGQVFLSLGANTDGSYNFVTPTDVRVYRGYFSLLQDGKLYFSIGNGLYLTGSSCNNVKIRTVDTVARGQWHHVVLTRTGTGKYASDLHIFVDNHRMTTEVVLGCDTISTSNIAPDSCKGVLLQYGNASGGNGGIPLPYMKNLRLYNRALDSAEIDYNYKQCDGLPYNTDSLRLWAKLNEGKGRAKDFSGYNTPARYLGEVTPPIWDTVIRNKRAWTGAGQPVAPSSCIYHFNNILCNYGYTDSLILCGKAEPLFPPDTSKPITNCSDSTFFAVSIGTERYQAYNDSIKGNFQQDYVNRCLQAYKLESFTFTDSSSSEYHYTLYYYDQAGNLIKTVPPQGVNPIRRQSWLDSVRTFRKNNQALTPSHRLITQYRYNSLNQVVAQTTPDAGKSTFYYDRLGRLVLSQNLKQYADNKKYSYTLYDYLGRISQVGELQDTAAMNNTTSRNPSSLQTWLTSAASTRRQITATSYDDRYTPLDTIMHAANLRNRVAWTAVYNTGSGFDSLVNYIAATFYSYDIHGNVDTLIQDYKVGVMDSLQNRFKKIVYQYDLISGKVNFVAYQPKQADAFYHRYTYDAENRITNVETSADSIYWENEAQYRYYLHGPLARTVIGEQQVQGIDYAYTLQGWLKGVNSTAINATNDMGSDGSSNSINRIGRDAYGFALYYYGPKDYESIAKSRKVFADTTNVGAFFKPLYNGNIAAMGVNILPFNDQYFYAYSYDQLNRLTQMVSGTKTLTGSTNTWAAASINNFKENVSYDANGNILKYKRYGNGNNNNSIMDSLNYFYYANTNKLNWIKDTVGASKFSVDIDNEATNNYVYDSIGNLTKDVKETIDSIYWNVYGKIAQINKHDGTIIKYTYDASGNRISKSVGNVRTWYVRDASGNVMSVYTQGDGTVNSGALSQTEIDLFGSSRLGLFRPNINVQSITAPPTKYLPSLGIYGYSINFIRGKKFFELTNHLGNVLVTISDKKVGNDNNNDTIVNFYTADVVSSNDYYPFGMVMPGRLFTGTTLYRYGFNGKESDNEIKGTGNEIDYGARVYDPRLGRFLSIDRLAKRFPYYSPYHFAGNTPIWANDLDGNEPNFTYQGNGIYGIGLFKEEEWGSIRRHEAKIEIGKGDKKFQIEWLLGANGDPIGYLASRIVPEEEYKRLYGGTGKGLQPAYIIAFDKWGEFGSNTDKYFDYSKQSELYDVLWGEIDRDPVKRLFDPRAWLLGEVGGLAGNLAVDFFKVGILRYASLSNTEVRVWYNVALSKINTKVAYTEENAKLVSLERNAAKQSARLLMKNRAAAAKLDETDPIRDFDYYKDKYTKQGYEGEELWKKIIDGSAKPNAEVNKKFGIQ